MFRSILDRQPVVSRRQRQSVFTLVGAVGVLGAVVVTMSPTVRGVLGGDEPLEVRTAASGEEHTGTTTLADATTDVLRRFATYGGARPAGPAVIDGGTGDDDRGATGSSPGRPRAGGAPAPLAPVPLPASDPGAGTGTGEGEHVIPAPPLAGVVAPTIPAVTGPSPTDEGPAASGPEGPDPSGPPAGPTVDPAPTVPRPAVTGTRPPVSGPEPTTPPTVITHATPAPSVTPVTPAPTVAEPVPDTAPTPADDPAPGPAPGSE